MSPRILILCILFCVASSCSNNSSTPPQPPEKKLEFWYYPKTNMYYDVTNKKYLYSLDGAKTWSSISDESSNFPATLGDRQVIYSNNDSIWKDNLNHRNTYHGKLYQILKDNNDLPSAQHDAREKTPPTKSIAKKLADKQRDSVNAPKKGIRGFFNRLFGKHKKK